MERNMEGEKEIDLFVMGFFRVGEWGKSEV